MRKIALALLLAAAPAAALAGAILPVTLNEAVRITLPGPARDVIIGNPLVADVTVSDSRHLILTGKAFGQTNLIVVGQAGRTIFDRELMVPRPMTGRVTMITGDKIASFACPGECSTNPDQDDADLSPVQQFAKAFAGAMSAAPGGNVPH